MSYINQELTDHYNYHCYISGKSIPLLREDNCEYCQIDKEKENAEILDFLFTTPLPNAANIAYQSRDNVFKANHRNTMIREHGYTEAMRPIQDFIENPLP